MNTLDQAIARRKFLKGASLFSLCSVIAPLQSFSDLVKSRQLQQAVVVECSVCKLVHEDGSCAV